MGQSTLLSLTTHSYILLYRFIVNVNLPSNDVNVLQCPNNPVCLLLVKKKEFYIA